MSESEPNRRGSYPIWLALGAVGLVIVVAIVTLPVFSGLRQWILPARRGAYPSCAINLQQIGLAIKMYASENNGYCPDGFEQLLLTQDIGPIVFVCPASNDTTATGKTLAEIVSNLSAGGHLSYFYNGKGKNGPVSSRRIFWHMSRCPIMGDRVGISCLEMDMWSLVPAGQSGRNCPRRISTVPRPGRRRGRRRGRRVKAEVLPQMSTDEAQRGG